MQFFLLILFGVWINGAVATLKAGPHPFAVYLIVSAIILALCIIFIRKKRPRKLRW